MPTFSRAPREVADLASVILDKFESHHPLRDAKPKIDFIFAHADLDPDTGEKVNNAIQKSGFRVLGQARKISLKERAVGRGDAEILIDADWWKDAEDAEREALLDHELNHLAVITTSATSNVVKLDDLGRPQIRLRKHDREYGFFDVIAARHGRHSQEQIQMRQMVERVGQLYLIGMAPQTAEEQPARNTTSARFRNIASDSATRP